MRFHDCRQKWLRGRQQAPGGLRSAGRRLRLEPISPTLVSGLGARSAEETPGIVDRAATTAMTKGTRDDYTYGDSADKRAEGAERASASRLRGGPSQAEQHKH